MVIESDLGGPHLPAGQRLAVLRALADPCRLAVLASLLERPHCVEELAESLRRAPSTLSFHLRRLEEAGLVTKTRRQYYLVYEPRLEMLGLTLRDLVGTPAGDAPGRNRLRRYREQVLRTFMRDGVLTQLPRQRRKRLVVLDELGPRFERGRRYAEPEVNALLAPVHEDYCTLRRLLVDEGYLARDGEAYWRPAEDATPLAGDTAPVERRVVEAGREVAGIEQGRPSRAAVLEPAAAPRARAGEGDVAHPRRDRPTLERGAAPEGSRVEPGGIEPHESRIGEAVSPMKTRRELIREYKQTPRRAGIFQIRNVRNGKVLLGSTRNLHGPLNRHRFLLSTGVHGNAQLQRDWNELGPDAFAFEVVAEIEPRDDPAFSLEDELVALEQAWLTKVWPFGDRGYNQSSSLRD